jgi:DNA-binding MarR family transcriptional regulator
MADDDFQDILLSIFQLHGQVLQAADLMSAEFGLSGARWQVMKVVERRPMTVSQIARRLGLQRQSVQRTVDSIEQQGLAELLPNVDHARANLVSLSPEGQKVLAALHRRQQAWLDRCTRGLGRAELERTASALADLAERVEQATSREEVAARRRSSGSLPASPGIRRRLVSA